MKNAIPPRTTTAPITIASALPLDRVLLPLVAAVALEATDTVGDDVVAPGVGETGDTPPDSGLVDPFGVTGTADPDDAVEVATALPPDPEALDAVVEL
jgi:hypothetical protein